MLAAEQQVCKLGEGKEVNKEGDDEGFHVLGGQPDGVGEHAHASVKLEHVNELQGGQEDNNGQHESGNLVPDANRHEVDIAACTTTSRNSPSPHETNMHESNGAVFNNLW